jgi:hypothetical protein
LLSLLNAAWQLVEPKPHYDAFNQRLAVRDIAALEALEGLHQQLGLANFGTFDEHLSGTESRQIGGLTTLSLLATVTDVLCGKRLAAMCEDDGRIVGWDWAPPIQESEQATFEDAP